MTADKTIALTQAISGLGGVGKTQIAVEYAYRYRDQYRTILWAKADSQESLVLDFVAIAHLLNLPEKGSEDQNNIVEAVKSWLDAHTQWLLILDNVENITILRSFLPSSSDGHVLLTTRTLALGTIAQCIEVTQMEPSEGVLFLLRRAKILLSETQLKDISADERDEAEELVQLMGGLPLALDQAGAYIEETGCSVSDYLERYRDQRNQLLKRRGLALDHHDSVALTFAFSFQKIKEVNTSAIDLLQLCAFLNPDAITIGLPDCPNHS